MRRKGGGDRATDGDGCMDLQVRRGAVELPNEAAQLGELETALLEELETNVMPAIEEVDKVCYREKQTGH